ncbi:MAG: T9SS type A sorting domain-containing protein, partial [Bacteroidales bacterium]|nr:T9SS type A sorting domain-containing protein [Bacteroidales bacterium]
SDPTTGDYDGVVIAIRRGSNSPVVLPDVPSALTANTTFGNASSEYGSNPDYSYIVYKGTGNSVTVTGLTQGEEYSIKAFSYFNDGYDNTNAVTTTSISSLDVDNVSSASATAGNTTATIQWSLPDLCYDQILVVGHAGSSVSSNPSGDGSTYTVSNTFGSGTDIGSSEYVVYLNSGTNTSVTGLTNGTMYYFTIFTRNGTEWSPGIEVTVTPSNVTYFNPGELVIVGFDAAIASSSSDKIYLATFVDILPGTEFLYVNSRFEAGASANERTLRWYGGSDYITEEPGIATITYSGTGITAGSIISFEIGSGAPHTFEVNGFSNSDFSGSISSNQANISSSGGDQLWLIQGVFTDHGNYNTLDGNVLYGLTSREAWVPLSSSVSGGGTRESRIHPDIECFNLEISGTDGYAYYKNGTTGTPGTPAHDATFRTILLDIMNPANWNSAGGDGVLNITEDFCDCDQSNISDAIGRKFCISSYTVEHQWIGDNDTDWFNCANWKGLHIPNEETDVLFDSDDCYDDIELTTQDTARCKNITFQGSGSYDFYAGGDSDKIIEIFGDININMNNSVVFDDSNSGTADGQLILHGDWINTVGDNGFKEGNSTVIFTDAQAQQITTSSGNESFGTLKIDKSAGNLTLNDNIETDYLNLTSGNINTGTNRVYISNTATGAIANSSTDSYINGNLRRDVSATGSYDFPVGTASNYELINIDLQSSTGLTYLDASFDSSVGTTEISSLNLTVNGTLLQEVLDGGFWTVTPNAGVTAVEYNAGLNLRGSSNAGTEPAQHSVIKRANSREDWAIRGNHDNDDQSISGGVVYAYRTSFNTFSDFAIAKHRTNILPVELLDFSIKCNGPENKLFWSTASEINNDYFEVQKSDDGNLWYYIGMVKGAGNSSKINNYSFVDKENIANAYYRLRQVDFDGKFEYSPAIFSNCNETKEINLIVYPNPVSDYLNVMVENWKSEKIDWEIVNTTGQVVIKGNFKPADSYFVEQINMSELKPGMYVVRFMDDNNLVIRKADKK